MLESQLLPSSTAIPNCIHTLCAKTTQLYLLPKLFSDPTPHFSASRFESGARKRLSSSPFKVFSSRNSSETVLTGAFSLPWTPNSSYCWAISPWVSPVSCVSFEQRHQEGLLLFQMRNTLLGCLYTNSFGRARASLFTVQNNKYNVSFQGKVKQAYCPCKSLRFPMLRFGFCNAVTVDVRLLALLASPSGNRSLRTLRSTLFWLLLLLWVIYSFVWFLGFSASTHETAAG